MAGNERESSPLLFNPFKDLKRLINEKRDVAAKGESSAKNRCHVSEQEIFQSAMREVREIEEFRALPVYQEKSGPSYRKSDGGDDTLKTLEEIVQGHKPINLADTQEYVEWTNEKYRSNVTTELHEGRFSVQDTLDLHGIIVEEAEKEIESFLHSSFKKGYRCIKIIHGRGRRSPNGPVLKKALITWLSSRFRKHIIAFVTARQCDGGLGALYVLLK
jgi:DNA-nicking Smr family endonuclease